MNTFANGYLNSNIVSSIDNQQFYQKKSIFKPYVHVLLVVYMHIKIN